MKHRTRTLAIAAAILATVTATRAELLFYEGFNYTDGTQVHGQGGWSNDPNDTYDGTTPATVSNTGSDDPFEVFDGTGGEAWDGDFTGVTQTGNFAGYAAGHLFATRSLDPSVTSTFTDGSTTWLSFINYTTSSRGAAVSLGAGPLTGDRSRYSQNENIGMGQIYNNASSRALTWAGGGAEYVTSATNLGAQKPQFLIAKIVWSDTGNDTITVVKFLEGDTITEAGFNSATTQSTLTGDFDQSLFDTINIGGAQCFVDEIRIATTFDDAVTAVPAAGVPNADNSSVTASPLVVPNDGTTTSTITVTLRDDDSVSVPNRDVTLTGNTGNATVTAVNSTTDVNGEAVFTVKSGTVETETFTAEDVTGGGSIVITETASVIFEDPALVDPATSTVTASLADVPADDSTTSTVTVTLKTVNGTPIPGKDVSLAATPAGATITAVNSTTDVNGEAAFTVRSGSAGTVEFSATDVTGGGSTAITETTSVVFTVDAPTPVLLFHEPFDYPDGSLLDEGTFGGWDDSPGNTGLVLEVFDGTGGEIWDGDFTGVAQTGNFAGEIDGHLFATRTLDPGVTSAFTDGSVSWLSFISHRGSSRGALVSIGAGPLTGDRSRYSADQNLGMGHYYSSATSRALTWAGGGAEYTSGTGLIDNQRQFLIARIVWSDTAPDTITVASFLEGETIDEAAFDAATKSILAADFDQSVFDTINIGNAQGYIDEIRIANTFDLAVNGTGGSGSDYDTWAGDYPGLGNPGDDDDGDGWTNDEERIFGLNPQDGSSANPFETPFDPQNGTFSYTRRTQSLTGLTYKVWYSTDLVQWFEDTVGTASQNPGTPTNQVEIVAVSVDPTLLSEPKLFIQISAEDLGPPPPAPELTSLWGSGTTITLNFSQAMNETTAIDTDNYTVELDGGGAVTVTGASLSGDGKTVTLTLGAVLGIDSAYNVIISNLGGSNGQPLAGSGTAQFRTWDNAPDGIQVFILAGQSNMVGHGKSQAGLGGVVGAIGSLRYLAVNDASYPDVDYSGLLVDPGDPENSAWATRSDVKVWWKDGYVTDPRTVRKGNLGIGYADSGSWFGPEYAFGRVMGDHFTAPVLIIKTAWGGIDLAQGFRPPTAVADRGGVVGPYYQAILDDVREVLGNLATEFPAAQHPEFDAVGYRYRIVGFGWHQGWNDGGVTAFANEYEANLADLIDDLRAEFGQPALPVAIANSGFGGVGAQTGNRLTVRQAQDTIGSLLVPHPVYSGTVLTDDTAPYWRDASVSPSNFGYHWNHNAETHYLIGKGMGEAMEAVLP